MSDNFMVLGFDIGGTKTAVCAADAAGEILASVRIPGKDRPPQDVLPEITAAGKTLVKDAGLELKALGIGAPGAADCRRGVILNPPNMPGWNNIPIRDDLAAKFNVPAYFDNDANAGALAEWIFGAGRGCENMIYLTLSTGIGGGIIANGRLLGGSGGFAGEMGHVCIDINGPECNCGMRGCYEAFCGGRALAQRLQRDFAHQPDHCIVKHAGGIDAIDMLAFEKAIRDEDPLAIEIWDEVCLRHAQALGSFINIFNPERIVLGTIALAMGELFMEPVKRRLPRFCWPEMLDGCELTVSALGRRIGEYSGVAVAFYNLLNQGQWPGSGAASG